MILYRLLGQRFVEAEEDALITRLSRVNAFCGGGGKTSLLFYLGRRLARRGEEVLLTTSTHLAWEKEAALSVDAALLQKAEGRSPLLAAAPLRQEKLTAFSEAEQTRLYTAFDRSLVEADGSRGLPLKLPRSGEPVLPGETDALFLVLGLGALGQKAGEAVHRLDELGPELYPELLSGTRILPVHIAEILLRSYLLKPAFRERPLTLLLNQADDPGLLQGAEEVAEHLLRASLLSEEQILATSFPPAERHPRKAS